MSIGQVYPSIACPSSPPEDLKPRVVKAHEETRKLQATYPPPPQPPAVDILSAHWSQQPPRLQTRVSTPQDLRRAVRAALRFDGSAHPASLPFSGNFLVDRGFAAARGARPLLDGVHALVPAQSAAQKASCGVIAQQLVRIIAEADGFTYTRQGAGSPLQGSRTVTGWYFHYVCDASRERLPKRNDCSDCKGSVYVSMSAERMYVYYTHRDWHSTEKTPAVTTPTAVPQTEGEGEEEEEEEEEEVMKPYPVRALPTPPRKTAVRPIAISQAPISPPESSPLESPFSINADDMPCPDVAVLPEIHPTPVSVDGSVHRNYTKLRALRDLVETWLPEDADGTARQDNPFLRPIFGFMIEWFKTAMDYPGVQEEIYRILDLENSAFVEAFLRDGRPDAGGGKWTAAATAGGSLRQNSIRSKRPFDTEGSECSLSPSAMAGGSWRHNRLADLFKLEHGSGGLGTVAETPVRSAAEKRKSGDIGDMAFHFGGRKKKTRVGL